jgi:hypothetical protein
VILVMMFVLILLQIKHWYIDFVNQTEEEVKHKGIYLDWIGIKHSAKHGVATFVILWAVLGWTETDLAFALATVDFLLHYHIDWLKMNYGNRDIRTPQFWNHLGLDQMAHQIVYIIIVGLTVL